MAKSMFWVVFGYPLGQPQRKNESGGEKVCVSKVYHKSDLSILFRSEEIDQNSSKLTSEASGRKSRTLDPSQTVKKTFLPNTSSS